MRAAGTHEHRTSTSGSHDRAAANALAQFTPPLTLARTGCTGALISITAMARAIVAANAAAAAARVDPRDMMMMDGGKDDTGVADP
jgi:hypothetical protein